MKKSYSLSAALFIGVAFSIAWSPAPTFEMPSSGEYGVCSKSTASDAIGLKLNDDHSFTFKDQTRNRGSVVTTGKWTTKGRTIVLSDFDEDISIPTRWKQSKNYPCIASRYKMNFIRICDCNKE